MPEHRAKYTLIQQALFGASNDLVRNWMLGIYSTETIVDRLADITGLSSAELLQELQYNCEHMTFIDGNAIDTIQGIRSRGTKVVVATDNMDTFRRWTVPALRINDLFDDVLTSDTTGAFKSQTDADGVSPFFDRYMAQNDSKAGEAVLIDDSIDTKVVETFGIDFLHVTPQRSLADHLRQLVG